MIQYHITLYVERQDQELELSITGTVSHYVPAKTHLRPEDCYDASGGEVEITSIKLRGVDWDGELTEGELLLAEQELFEAYKDAVEADYDDNEPFEDIYD